MWFFSPKKIFQRRLKRAGLHDFELYSHEEVGSSTYLIAECRNIQIQYVKSGRDVSLDFVSRLNPGKRYDLYCLEIMFELLSTDEIVSAIELRNVDKQLKNFATYSDCLEVKLDSEMHHSFLNALDCIEKEIRHLQEVKFKNLLQEKL